MRVMVILVVIGALGTVPKGLKKCKSRKSEEESRPDKLQHY